MENILTSLWLGFRLSLKTVGSLCLLGFLGGTLVHTFVPKWPSLRIKQVIYSIATVLLTFLSVSYTHLDVYKRQAQWRSRNIQS